MPIEACFADAQSQSTREASAKSNSRLTVMAPRSTSLIGGVLGFAWFILVLGLSMSNPTYLGWVDAGGWRAACPWVALFPSREMVVAVRSVSSFPYPVGTTVGYTDSIPWVRDYCSSPIAVPAGGFPIHWSMVGIVFFSAGLVWGENRPSTLTPNPLIQILGGALLYHGPCPALAHRP